jgi:hypothetical protein
VTSHAATTRRSDSTRKLARGCIILSAVGVGLFLVVGAVLASSHGVLGWVAAGVAAGFCVIGSVTALVLVGVSRVPSSAVSALLVGIFARTGLPLAGGIALSFYAPRLAEAGLMAAVMTCYLVTLVVETALSVGLVNAPKRTSLPRGPAQSTAQV